ncbi:hypothetical protein [Pararhodonellum marinum]|uniref:hypothetical protein n=1 Tax=Pararhodonellum marinum TaxID=2755358 RepID=UPI00188DE9D6|nr:hypothetical protein [Pararhodonellum marinum]
MKKIVLITLSILVFLLIGISIFTAYQFRDRHRGYALDLSINSKAPQTIQAGFSKIDITPQNFDTWNDHNQDGVYDLEAGDTYNDLNGNGKFDPIWLAGFHQSRPANGVNDPLWARTMFLNDGQTKIALCVIDMIGFGNDEVLKARKKIQESMDLDYVIISSTHVHSSPDLMGMWGPNEYKSGVNPTYLNQVIDGIVESVNLAVQNSQAAYFKLAEDLDGALDLVGDTRDPQVFDAGLRVMQVLSKESNETLGTLLNWGNHPETLWLENVLISSDFPHFFRKYVEDGIFEGDSLLHPGLGGVAVFMNGAVGGLMTTHPSVPVIHPLSGEELLEENVAKIDAQGMALAQIALEALENQSWIMDEASISLRAKSILLPMDNDLFLLAAWLRIFDRGFVTWRHIRSEVAVWTLGPISFVHFPGELYPEILNGGVESPEGQDYSIDPVEVPAIRDKMPGKMRFFNGMANDMIGYIVPKSQWDAEPPYTYGREERPYGEINSLGPQTAPILHQTVMELLGTLTPPIEIGN